VGLGMLVGLTAVSLLALVVGAFAGRIAFRLVPVGQTQARVAGSQGKAPVA